MLDWMDSRTLPEGLFLDLANDPITPEKNQEQVKLQLLFQLCSQIKAWREGASVVGMEHYLLHWRTPFGQGSHKNPLGNQLPERREC